jgi:hypothetical protein
VDEKTLKGGRKQEGLHKMAEGEDGVIEHFSDFNFSHYTNIRTKGIWCQDTSNNHPSDLLKVEPNEVILCETYHTFWGPIVRAYICYEKRDKDNLCWIGELACLDEQIGLRLLQHVVNLMAKYKIASNVNQENQRAVNIYTAAGFKRGHGYCMQIKEKVD